MAKKKHEVARAIRVILLLWAVILLGGQSIMVAQEKLPVPAWSKETKEQKNKRMEWWTHDRFGMFIHWGLYALPARHEWVKHNEKMTNEQYQKYFDHFNPDLYQPKLWAARAKAAGMKYVTITTKHHEGFCLWDSKYTDYKSTNTPCHRDLIKELVDACRAEGLRVGFYYSLIDWHHPDFPYDNLHPEAPKDSATRAEANKHRDLKKYQQYMKNQLAELLTNYGQIDELFLDFSYEKDQYKMWDAEGLLQVVRRLQPQIIVDDRLGLGDDNPWGWDYKTPEQYMPVEWPRVNGEQVPWETCQTFSGSWGYHRDEASWKSVPQLVVLLIETVSKGGNLLLNVGPTARGEFDYRANDRLDGIAEWMSRHNRAIYGCTQAPQQFQKPDKCLLTYNPETKRLYVHVLDWPCCGGLPLPGFKGKFKYAQLLNDASEVRFNEDKDKDLVNLSIPVQKPNVAVPVIELFLE
ncbi:MAG: alpha-L-fucosidase [Bacteroidales bacterium]|jgi:alpha-L-fucosidase|nr:alpha-L-fucosidase [Bacteroidales bacterium]